MATLVLSTIGTALGGPVGGAIGALIGQSIDQEVLAPSSRGPRVGDLSVQSSSYGTQIPRMYGTMRVAGSVVWSTDLVESDQTTGAKGQPDVTYSYSVSFAVALSSRPVSAIGRIWADGKLLRGAEGDFKVSTIFRLYDGSQDQAIDPLIGSIEGIANTPAYRGLALAVFENLELADYGNRIPFLTFEVIADGGPPSLATMLGDVSAGAIACGADRTLVGYAAYGASIRAAVEPLVTCFAIDLFDDGSHLRSPLVAPANQLSDDELGCSADRQAASRLQREQLASRMLPAALRLTYYDPDRDYQAGEARGMASEQSGNELRQELAAVLTASDAKSLVEAMLARAWASKDRLTLRLPPERLALEPGSELLVGLAPNRWIVEKCSVDGFVTVTELRAAWSPNQSVAAASGRIVGPADVMAGDLTLALFDVSDVFELSSSQPTLLLAASNSSRGWKRMPIELSFGGQTLVTETARRKSFLGRALTALNHGQPYLIDMSATVDVELIDPEQWLSSCDDEALGSGANLAILGAELFQFGQATAIAPGRFRLSRLLRARGATEWAMADHTAGELFCLLNRASVRPLTLPRWTAAATTIAVDPNGASTSAVVEMNSIRPLAPTNFSAVIDATGSLNLTWTRRSRSGWSWVDEVDAPLGEAREAYRINARGSLGEVELESDQPRLTLSPATLASIGSGLTSVEVRQIGDWAMSRPAALSITLP